MQEKRKQTNTSEYIPIVTTPQRTTFPSRRTAHDTHQHVSGYPEETKMAAVPFRDEVFQYNDWPVSLLNCVPLAVFVDHIGTDSSALVV